MTTALKKPSGIIALIDQLVHRRMYASSRRELEHRRPPLRQQTVEGGNRVNGVVNRRSEAWRDGIGPGYVTGVTQNVLDVICQNSKD